MTSERIHRRCNKKGEIVEYRYATIGSIPVKEYARLKAKEAYKPRPHTSSKLGDNSLQLLRELHQRHVPQRQMAKILGVSLYMVRKNIVSTAPAAT